MKAKNTLKDLITSSFAKKETENPYLNARRTWNEHVGSVVSSRFMWQMIGILCLLITLAAVGGVVHIGSQSKFIPLIFREDAQRNVISVTQADRIGKATVEDYRAAAVNFIENVRTVTPDVALQRKAVFRVYAALSPNDPATAKTNEFLNGTEDATPFNRAQKETVSFDLKSALEQLPGSWQVDWLETVRDRQGILKHQTMMRALITLYQAEPTEQVTAEEAIRNPHFIFVRDYNWSKLLHGGVN